MMRDITAFKAYREEEISVFCSQKLKSLGISPKLKGYRYLVDAIVIAMTSNSARMEEIYEKIALNMESKNYNIERSMRYAIEILFSKGDLNEIYNIFGYSVDSCKGRPTNREFIVTISDYLYRIL